VSAYRNLALRPQGAGECVQIGQDRCHSIASVAKKLLRRHGIVAYVARVIEQGRLADGNEVLKEAFAGVGEGGVRPRVERRPEAHLLSGEDLEVLAMLRGIRGLHTSSCLIRTKPSLRRPSSSSDRWTSSGVGSSPSSKYTYLATTPVLVSLVLWVID